MPVFKNSDMNTLVAYFDKRFDSMEGRLNNLEGQMKMVIDALGEVIQESKITNERARQLGHRVLVLESK